MKKIVSIVLMFIVSILLFVGCVSKDNYKPYEPPLNPAFTGRVFEVDGEFITYVHLHIPDSNITTYVNIPTVFVHTQDLLYYREVESLEGMMVTGNDDVAVNKSERLIYAKKADTPIIDNLITLYTRGDFNDLQIRVTKGDYENWTVCSVQFTQMAT